ncbi:ribosome-binding protein 1 [Galendromus occidentalis]|uniref:Ribosome-binding protein 1 n=1 Tax=Galendromus occidentalis TaxID=34638 RepID=A0AAJ7SGY6_9ACAR|nr:ribosome-binding protein 1 [Galendromus occidentalis]
MEVMEKLVTSNVAYFGVAATALFAGIIVLVYRMNPGPNYEEVFRKQREQLMAMDEPKQKKKEKATKKKDKRADKKEPQHASTASTTASAPTAVATADDSVKHDHVDFSVKEQIKYVELDEIPQVETGKVLAPSRQPAKPILVHSEEENKTSPVTESAGDPLKIARSNSFREIKPKDEVELHHKKQQQSPSKASQTTAPTAKVAPISVSHQPQRFTQPILGTEEESQLVSQKKQGAKGEASETGSSKKNSPVHEKKERKAFSKKELKELINQIEQRELPADMGEETVQRLVDALLNHQNESKEWKSTRQDPMQVLRKKIAEKEEAIVQLNTSLESSRARSRELHSENTALKTKCSQIQNSVAQIENRFKDDLLQARSSQQQVESQMKHVEAFNETLHGRVRQLEIKNKEMENSLREAQEQVHASSRFAESVDELNERIRTLELQVSEVTSVRDKLDAEKRQIEANLQTAESELSKFKSISEEAHLQVASLKNDLSGARSTSQDANRLLEEKAALQEELEQLKTRNTQLHQKNWTAVEGLIQAEKKLSELQKKTSEDEERNRKLLIQAFPKEAAGDLKDLDGDEFVKKVVQQLKLQSKETEKLKAENSSLKTKLSEAVSAAQAAATAAATVTVASAAPPAASVASLPEAEVKSNSANDEANEEIERLREEVSKLQKDVAHYTTVLNDTEKLLKNLEEGVEREEQKWSEDRKRFESEKTEMTMAFRDLESRLRELQAQLQDSEQERSSTINELDDTKAAVDKLSQQLAEAQQAVPPAQAQRNGHQSEDSTTTSPTPSAQQNGGGHDGVSKSRLALPKLAVVYNDIEDVVDAMLNIGIGLDARNSP